MTATYASTAQVNTLLGPHKVTEITKLTLSDLEQILLSIDSELESRLRTIGISTIPVVDPTFRTYLGTLASWSGAAQALRIQFPEASGPGENPAADFWETRYQNALKGFTIDASGSFGGTIVPDALLTSKAVSSYFTRNPDEELLLPRLQGAHLFTVDDLREKPW